jgi:hypothetical protein
VPARVAVGFTSGSYDSATRRWVVTDLDAHAWVEAWFPRYGWVRFDPTPAAAPALGGRSPISASSGSGQNQPAQRPLAHGHGTVGSTRAAGHTTGGGSGPALGAAELAIVALVLVGALGALAYATRPLPDGEAELAELERAFARAARPLAPATTLLALERRLADSPQAAAYVRALRLKRFGTAGDGEIRRQRRALRAQLHAGLGPLGRLRALWALPPRRRRRAAA